MANSQGEKDLIVLVPDSNTEYALKGLLSRPEALGTRRIHFTIGRHPERDPGCYLRAPDFLRVFRRSHRHAMVLLDHEGSGRESQSRTQLEANLEQRLAPDWNDRAAAVVIDPELEIWLWSNSPHVDRVLGWHKRKPALRSWLVTSGYASKPLDKPLRPKEAAEAALRLAGKPRSSAIYRRLAEQVSLRKCTDPAFQKLARIIRTWFPST